MKLIATLQEYFGADNDGAVCFHITEGYRYAKDQATLQGTLRRDKLGWTLWVLGISEDNKLYRLPLTIFDGKEYKIKDQIIKTAELMIYLENRRPVKLRSVNYYKLKFMEDGTIDKKHYEEGRSLQFSTANIFVKENNNDIIISGLKYKRKYSWTPATNEIKLINRYLNSRGLPLYELLSG